MKKILLVPFLILVLGGCSKSDAMVVQEQCSQYKDGINQELVQQCMGDMTCSFKVDRIFYSSKTNSCLYGFYRERTLSTDPNHPTSEDSKVQVVGQWGWYVINDFASKKTIYTSKMIWIDDAKAMSNKKAEYEKKLKEFN